MGNKQQTTSLLPPPKQARAQFATRMRSDQLEKIRALSEKHATTVTALIERAIDEYIAALEKSG